GLIGGIWLVFIGWFLSGAASASYRQILVKKLLEGVPIARLMRRSLPPALDANAPVRAIVDEMLRSGEELFMATAAGRAIGLVHADDVRRLPRSDWELTPIERITTPLASLGAASPRDDAYQVLRRLGRGAQPELPVTDGGELVGVVRAEDVAR